MEKILEKLTMIYKKMKNHICSHQYETFIISLAVLTYLSYIGLIQTVFIPFLIALTFLCILLRKDVTYLIPIPVFLQMSTPSLMGNAKLTTIYIVIFVVLVIFDFLYNRKPQKLGKMFIPILILLGASVITGVNTVDAWGWFVGIYQVGTMLFVYLYFLNTTTDKPDLYLRQMAKMFLYAGVLVTFEIFHVIAVSELDPLLVIRGRVELGWENPNVIIYANMFSVILVTNVIRNSKYKVYYMALAIISAMGILLTLSRSSILTLAVYLLFVIPFIIVKSKRRVNLIIQGVSALLILTIVLLLLERNGLVSGYYETLMGRDLFHFDDRGPLLEVAWEQFKLHPIFGSGGIYISRYYLTDFGTMNYHNTIAQVSTLGLVGIGAFIYFFIEKTKIILSKHTEWKWVVFTLIYATAFVNGWFQPMYFYVTYVLYLFIILSIYENIESNQDS